MNTLLLGLVLLVAQAQPPAPPTPQPPGRQQQAEQEYVVGIGDLLAVRVFGEDAYTRDAPVESDGTIDVADIGRVPVVGKTTRQIAQAIASEYVRRNLLLKPNVIVTVKDYRSQQVWVTGQVKNPGAIQLKGNLSLMAALSEVDYFTSDAGPEIHIFHAKPGQSADAPALTTGKPDVIVTREQVEAGQAGTVRLQDGDTINVPKAPQFYVSGNVRNPGQYAIRPGLTVWDAVASLAGGLDQYAAKNRITIIRTVNGKQKEVHPKDLLKELVQPDDRIIVPRRRF